MIALGVALGACSGDAIQPNIIGDQGSAGSGAMSSGVNGGSGTGAVGPDANNGAGTSGGILPDGTAKPPGACGRTLEAPRAVLLTDLQYATALRDLLGETAVSDQMLAEAGEPEVEVIDRPWVTTGTLDRVLRTAETAVETLRGKTASVLKCSALTDKTCVRGALTKIARRAWKRAPAADELDGLMGLYDEAAAAFPTDSGESATLIALQGLLTTPATLYRTEFTGTVNGMTQAMTADEVAASLAVMLLDSVPDDALIAAADDGSILTPVGLQAQVERLLALPRVKEHLTALVLNAYRATRVFETLKDEMVFPDYTPAMQGAMYEETRRFVEDVLWTRDAPLSELLSSRSSFVNGPLAKLYGIPFTGSKQDEFVPAQLPPERSGLLTEASILSVLARTDKTSVVARGLFVRSALLCLPKIPAPPASVQQQVAAQLSMNATQKELAAYRAMTSPCMGCHSQFDRFGLALEGFDPIGKLRTPGAEPVDLAGLGPLMGTVSSAGELVAQLNQDARFTRCLSERVLDYALTTTQGGDAYCETDPLHQAVAADATMADLVRAIVNHPAFATRSHTDM